MKKIKLFTIICLLALIGLSKISNAQVYGFQSLTVSPTDVCPCGTCTFTWAPYVDGFQYSYTTISGILSNPSGDLTIGNGEITLFSLVPWDNGFIPNVGYTYVATIPCNTNGSSSYLVEVTNSENSSTATASLTILDKINVGWGSGGPMFGQNACYPANNNGIMWINPTTSPGGGGPFTYVWSPGGATTNTISGLTGGMNYTVTVTDAQGCSNTTFNNINDPQILFCSPPCVDYYPNNSPSCDNGVIIINPYHTIAPYTYVWSPNVSTNNTASNLSSGAYSITVTDAHGCTGVYTYTLGGNSGCRIENPNLLDPPKPKDFNTKLYPNPNDGNFTFEYNLMGALNGILCIYNDIGEQVMKIKISGEQGTHTVDAASLSNGIYFWRLDNDSGILNRGKINIMK